MLWQTPHLVQECLKFSDVVTDTRTDRQSEGNTARRTEKTMTTLLNEQINTGDVIEMSRG